MCLPKLSHKEKHIRCADCRATTVWYCSISSGNRSVCDKSHRQFSICEQTEPHTDHSEQREYTHTREGKGNWWRRDNERRMRWRGRERESSCTRLKTCNDEQTFPVCFSVFDTSASNNKSCVVPSARVRTRTQNETNQPDVSYNNLSSTQFSQQLFHALPIPSSHFCVSSASSVPLVLTCA